MAAQSLPVGSPILEDYLRRQQLLGNLDSTISFTARPLYPANLEKPVSKNVSSFSIGRRPNISTLANQHIITLSLLPITWQQQYNTHHPYSLNDGEMIPARGYQTLVSAGVFIKAGPLTLQLKPEFVFAENKYFDGFGCGIGVKDQVWIDYYKFLNTIDLPERFGDKAYSRLSWGQSSLRFNFGAFSTGISNENLWWGPGMRNSLLMSNTSGGFMHLTFNTTRPIRTKIGRAHV